MPSLIKHLKFYPKLTRKEIADKEGNTRQVLPTLPSIWGLFEGGEILRVLKNTSRAPDIVSSGIFRWNM
jgi:hypothetical protein